MNIEDHLRLEAPRLTARVLDEVYSDPFWLERFGERGRLHALADRRYHVHYLVESLLADDAEVFATYALWQRDLMLARGGCSHHLEDHFVRLGAAIIDERWPDAARAIDVLAHGVRALVHPRNPARAIDEVRPSIVLEALDHAPSSTPATLATLTSYLTDALAAGSPTRLLSYTNHLRTVGRHAYLDDELAALGTAITALVHADHAAEAIAFLVATAS